MEGREAAGHPPTLPLLSYLTARQQQGIAGSSVRAPGASYLVTPLRNSFPAPPLLPDRQAVTGDGRQQPGATA